MLEKSRRDRDVHKDHNGGGGKLISKLNDGGRDDDDTPARISFPSVMRSTDGATDYAQTAKWPLQDKSCLRKGAMLGYI